MPSIDWSNVSRGDVYILDLNEVIFIWNGAKSNRYERLQAMQRAKQLRDERGKTNILIIEDGEENKMNKEELKLFESKLSLRDKNSKLNLNEIIDENDDDKRSEGAHIKLYKCSDESGTLKVTEKKAGPLVKNDLESEVS
jgi:villin 1/advillin